MCDFEQPIFSEQKATETLARWFKHSTFRSGQLAPIRAVCEGRDAVVIMPTGSGKSLCYQLAAMLLPGTTLVISPLIALMKDQVDNLEALGIPCTFLNSTVPPDTMAFRLAELQRGAYKLVYIAPERFRNQRFMATLNQVHISLLTIDEAHCISQWGHDFRPDYLNIHQALRSFPHVRVMAVTATATPDVRKDIITQLKLGKEGREAPYIQVQGFQRPNLSLSVTRCRTHQEKLSRIVDLALSHKTGIVYVATRKQAERIYAMLTQNAAVRTSSQVLLYHGALPDDARAKIQESFTQAEHPIVVATNAFGMGVDRSDIRFVAHWDIPGSIEAYYQEVGRAGRDGKPSFCDLLFNYADVRTQQFFIDGANPSIEDAKCLLSTIQHGCADGPKRFSAEDWAEMAGIKNAMAARTILGILERAGYIDRIQEPGQRICTTSLRPNTTLDALNAAFEKRREKESRDRARLQAVLHFVDYPGCRHAFILSYFGEEVHSDVCGGCDHCGPRTPARPLTEEQWIVIQKILSCVGRMKGRYGARRVIQVLRGAKDDPYLAEHGLDQLSTFGLLHAFPESKLRTLIDSLLRAECIHATVDAYRTLSLTAKGNRVARRAEPDFKIRWPGQKVVQPQSVPLNLRVKRTATLARLPVESPAMARVKAWREKTAESHHVPTFHIFSNKTMQALVRANPKTLDELAQVKGIGPVLLSRYGNDLLNLFNETEQ